MKKNLVRSRAELPKINTLPVTEFYFVRHAETVYNAMKVPYDDPNAILSQRGIQQAHMISETIESLPIQTVCVSPYLRAKHTMEIITKNIKCDVVVIDELRECTMGVWDKMVALEHPNDDPVCRTLMGFMNQVFHGVNQAVKHPGPILIVAHGGVHWALCHQMEIYGHERDIDNCLPVHFYQSEQESWKARLLRDPW